MDSIVFMLSSLLIVYGYGQSSALERFVSGTKKTGNNRIIGGQ